ncbi:hypothetical protein BCR33DRAFT_721971 [Rhizoclosmatium globosum]|uniref:Uncharacterized protein n=1 Tax=Rhizoclosmatium globosum TaxID=329046 RepID=A0A1Y2BNW7_9FUNG|nr:hypothetical protein BCR33DRAFT_721971 [Rhizoclosmatium globosum]|eukprot:ORY36442.1 hypothetical protein BCR33DRAFT_721971 [Rhizoclosmatium globosum]
MGLQRNLTFAGSHFERFVAGNPDCVGGDTPVSDPSADKLKCLEFTLPSNFSAQLNEANTPTDPFFSYFSFTDNSNNCKGSDLASRLQDVYARNITVNTPIFLSVQYNNTEAVPTDAHFINSISIGFWLDATNSSSVKPPKPPAPERRGGPTTSNCNILWASSVVQFEGQYILDYKNPICGPEAPKIVDNSTQTREDVSLAEYSRNYGVGFWTKPLKALSDAYGLTNSSIIFKSIDDRKFSLSVTSDASSPSADNSCVYTYLATDRSAVLRNFTLQSYDLGSLPLSNETTPADGCISEFTTSRLFSFIFTNDSSACGATDNGIERFGRYFSVPIALDFRYLDVADGIFNITVSEDSPDRRRDGNAATFVFFDKSFIPTTTTSTIAPTSTAVSTFASSSTVSQSASAKASASQSASGSAVVATTTVADAVPTGYAAPTVYAAPAAYGAPTVAYGAPAGNNLYKGASAGKVGIVSALVAAFVFAF